MNKYVNSFLLLHIFCAPALAFCVDVGGLKEE